jgi:PAS domain S-box-containing protein
MSKVDNERLAAFPKLNPNPVFEVDLNGKITYINDSGKKRFPNLEKTGIPQSLLAGWDEITRDVKQQKSGSVTIDIALEKSTFHLTVVQNPESKRYVVYVLDITDLKKAEAALVKSEADVKAKLNNLLAPEGEISGLELADIVDAPAIQAIVDDFYAISGIPMGLISVTGDVIVGAGWQDICTMFHRVNPDTRRFCVESDISLTKGIPEGQFKLYRCKNGMWDVATPVIVGGHHAGNLFSGQFFFDDEPPDRDFFAAQAEKYGFDVDDYLEALDRVPRINREQLNLGLSFYQKLAESISKLSYSNISLARLVVERDALTKEILESEERLNRAEAIANLGSWELDLVNNQLTWSDEVYRIFGLRPHEFEATYEAFLESIHPDDRKAVDDAYTASVREKRDTYEIDHRIVRKPTGEVRFVKEKCQHFRNEAGNIIRSVGMIQDITERKKTEEFMRSELRMLTEANTSAATLDEMIQIFLKEAELLTGSNIGFYHFVESDQETLSLQSWSENTLNEMCTAEGKGSHYPVSQAGVWADCVRERSPIVHNDYCALAGKKGMPEGHATVIRELVAPISRDGKIVAIYGVGNKTSDYDQDDVQALARLSSLSWEMINRKRYEEELSRKSAELMAANNELEAFAYSVSHDLRAPLRALDGFSQALLEDYGDKLDTDGVDYLRTLRSESQRMADLIDDLLNLSRMTRHEMSRENVDLSSLAKSVVDSLAKRDKKRNVSVKISPGLIAVGDKHLLKIALENLINNAWKFTSQTPNPAIEFGVEVQDGQQVYFVRDNGVGFDMEYADKLFSPFQRLHQAAEFPGTGIGLATVQRIIRRHGGKVWADSRPGQGAVFYFKL